MFTFLKYILRNAQTIQFTGALLDKRLPSEKEDDVHFSEVVASANAVLWREKYPDAVKQYPVLNQNQSNSCGANALAKAWGTMLYASYDSYVALSREHIYQRRENRPTAGMALYDMFKIAEKGAALELIVKSNGQNDTDYDNAKVEPWMEKEGETWKVSKGIYVGNDIETIASIIQITGKGVIILTWFLAGEWSKEIPYIVNNYLGKNDPSALRHFVTAVDFTLYKGKKYLVIEDSAHFGNINRRLISEEWVTNRTSGGGYLMNFKFQEQSAKPSYDGMTIISTQQCLRSEGLFPTNISFVENIGPITRSALINFQKKYSLPQSGIIDLKTQNKLHQIYP